MTLKDKTHWSRFANEWIEWASRFEHDAFWAFKDRLKACLGPGHGRQALEIGCGEGRVSRELKQLGYEVTATDAVEAMVEAARKADSAHHYAVTEGHALGFENARFDLVMLYNVLMDVDDPAAVVGEAARLLKPGGFIFISVTHPFQERGFFENGHKEPRFILPGTYYGRERFDETMEKEGLVMHFAGWSRPLEDYAAILEKSGLAITALFEPVPAPEFSERLKLWRRLPMFLWLKAAKINCE